MGNDSPLLEKFKPSFHWVKGHAGHPQNERCDELAVMASEGKIYWLTAIMRPIPSAFLYRPID